MYIQKSLKTYIDNLAGKSPVPGGGSASALVSALGIALDSMAANFSLGNPNCQKSNPEIKKILKRNEKIRKRIIPLIDKDTIAYLKLDSVLKLAKDTRQRGPMLQKCLRKAAEVPLEVCVISYEAMKLCFEIGQIGNKNLITDVGCAAYFLESAFFSAMLNVRINLKGIKDKNFISQKNKMLGKMSREMLKFKQNILTRVEESL